MNTTPMVEDAERFRIVVFEHVDGRLQQVVDLPVPDAEAAGAAIVAAASAFPVALAVEVMDTLTPRPRLRVIGRAGESSLVGQAEERLAVGDARPPDDAEHSRATAFRRAGR